MKGWRTVAWNVLALLAFAAIFQDWIIPAEYRADAMALHAMIFGAGNIGLRAVTTTPLGKKE
jgi:hypothetical protein